MYLSKCWEDLSEQKLAENCTAVPWQLVVFLLSRQTQAYPGGASNIRQGPTKKRLPYWRRGEMKGPWAP